ncbi:metallophosphoesterase [Sphingomonas sp. Leaf407]|uniref:metallophosphoesterase family protein n=1 Tax=unclassified Sphingomonas TaxID=196159 RepID=UPI0006FBBA35|nr:MULTISPECIES: metallophosphoesterase [unclassified Sphingomonas]KQN40427.1 metallophosphoesterase [Sphingomonas sp. Leaf42]KQT29781.1 metallophosphoesterase [Sphingomonas sp. Leaf407]
MTQPAVLSWVHIGDLHMDEAGGWESRDRLAAIVAEINDHVGDGVDFVYLPGDNANHATAEQYRVITDTLASLRLPYRVIPGDHDYETGDLARYEAAFPVENRPEVEVIAGHRCIFLDIVSAGAGGPDFRLTMHHRNRLRAELARAEAAGQVPVVFMHAYPGDLAADGEEIARFLADARVAFVDTGHTHYNELLNDGRVVYGATRSTGEIEEGDGRPGFSIVTLHDRVPSWRFKETGGAWPFVQIVAPADIRLVTRPADPTQVPRPGTVSIVARLFGDTDGPVLLSVDGGSDTPMVAAGEGGLWSAAVELAAGAHRIAVTAGDDRDVIGILVRGEADTPRRGAPIASGRDLHTIGAWPDHGIMGTQLGPNKNGRHW